MVTLPPRPPPTSSTEEGEQAAAGGGEGEGGGEGGEAGKEKGEETSACEYPAVEFLLLFLPLFFRHLPAAAEASSVHDIIDHNLISFDTYVHSTTLCVM